MLDNSYNNSYYVVKNTANTFCMESIHHKKSANDCKKSFNCTIFMMVGLGSGICRSGNGEGITEVWEMALKQTQETKPAGRMPDSERLRRDNEEGKVESGDS